MKKSGSLLVCSSKYQIKYALHYPFRYSIQLLTGSRREHTASLIDGYVYESKPRPYGIVITPYEQWLATRNPETQVYLYEVMTEFTEDQNEKAINYVLNLVADYKYNTIENILYKIPFLRSFRFKIDKFMFCDKLSLRIYQVLGLIPADLYCAAFDPDDVPDVLGRLINGKEIVKL